MKEVKRDAKYWRFFYIYQQLLARDVNYMETISVTREGVGNGVRAESSLPFTLIELAHQIANIEAVPNYNELAKKAWHKWNTLKDHPRIVKQRKFDSEILHTQPTDVNQYHLHLDRLQPDMRAMLDAHIEADNYYIVKDDTGTVHGGFATRKNGYLTGLFALKKGIGKDLFKLRLYQAKIDLDNRIKSFTIYCTGQYLKEFYEEYGFEVENKVEWNDEFATIGWNYHKFGRPFLYEMTRGINF